MALLLTLLLLFPQDNKATVYFYRLEEVGRFQGNKPKVYINDKLVLMMPESEFIGVKLSPGQYVIRMSGKRTETLLKVESGQAYFVRISRVGDGFEGMKDSIYLADKDQALFSMRDFKPVQDKNIKDKTLEVAREKP